MKYSIYNSIQGTTGGTSILYNAGSDNFVLFNSKLQPLLNKTPDALAKENTDFYKELVSAGAIISDEIDEYNQQLIKAIEAKSQEESFEIMINPTLDCNLHCWYCYENHIKDSIISPSTLVKIKNFINNTISHKPQLKTITLSFFGGEPLINFDIVSQIITFTNDACERKKIELNIVFTSNGVLLNNEMVSFFTKNDLSVTFQITLDGGREYHNKVRFSQGNVPTYDAIIENIHLLVLHKISVILRINFTKDSFESIPSILEVIMDIPIEDRDFIKIDLQQVWQDKDDSFDITVMMDTFIQNGFEVSSPLISIDNLRYPCYADKLNQMLINYNGDVYKCSARDFTPQNKKGVLTDRGEVLWTDVSPQIMIQQFHPKEACKTCNIFPLCGGGCIQKNSEVKDTSDCVLGIDEELKKEIILNRFYCYFVKNHQCNE